MNTQMLNGATVGWTDTGSGRATLLLHAGGFGAWFEPVAAMVDGRSINMFRAGYVNVPESAQISVIENATHAALLLEHLAVEPVTVVAHSSGCVFALQLALDRPDVVTRLVLSEPPLIGPLLDPADSVIAESGVGPLIGAAVGAAAAGEVSRALDMFLAAVCGPDYRGTVAAALGPDWHVRAERDAAFFFANEIPALMAWTPGDLARVETPTLLVHGGDSPPLTKRLIDRLSTTLPNSHVATIANANHLLPLTHCRELVNLLNS